MKTIGIIGGLGPDTTSKFYLNLVAAARAENDSALPHIIISSVPLPSEVEKKAIVSNKGVEECLPYLLEEAERLETAGADVIVMPCNSLHVFIEKIRMAVSTTVLSIVEETVRFLQERGKKKVGVVATDITRDSGLYEKSFVPSGIEYFVPDNENQKKVGSLVHSLVQGKKTTDQHEILNDILKSFDGLDPDAIILACTDLQLLAPVHHTVEIFDTMQILARATRNFAKE